ncbi:MAG: T9SS type A sorting domain-containing protein [Bacteroidota bacterium]
MNRFLRSILLIIPIVVFTTLEGQEICNNGIDDDGDSLIDYNDPDCSNFNQGSIFYERWYEIEGDDISDLTSHENYPFHADEFGFLTNFSSQEHLENAYGTRIRGYIHPTESGSYKFVISGDNDCEFYLSSNDNPDNMSLRASINGYTEVDEFTKYSSQISNSISLTAGQKYYVEFLQKEGSGGDHLNVHWITPSSSDTTLIDGAFLSPFPVEICGDGIDNDNDGNTDCADGDCDNVTPCQVITGSIFATSETPSTGVGAYQVYFTNSSTTEATFSISDNLPIGFVFSQDTIDFDGGGSFSLNSSPTENATGSITWSEITLPAGETVRLAYEFVVANGTPNGTFNNNITISGAVLNGGFLTSSVNVDNSLKDSPNTYQCEPAFYQVYKKSGNNTPNVYGKLNPITGDYDQIAIASDFANGLGFDVNTGLVFGASGKKFIQLDANGVVIDLGIRFPKNCFRGDMHPNGLWYGTVGNDMYKIDPSVPEIVDIHYGQGLPGWDFAYNVDGNFYGLHKKKLYKYEVLTNMESYLGEISGSNLPNSGHGGQWTGSDGYLYASNNSSGKIIRVDVEQLEGRVVSSSVNGLSKNDGFSCPMDIPAVYEFDYGDNSRLPDVRILTYYQDLGNDGVPDYTTVYLGSTVDYDSTNPKNSSATGDNDDGFSITETVSGGNVEATLTINSNENLTRHYAIGLDWDDDGAFDDVIIGNQQGNGVQVITEVIPVPLGFDAGTVNARAVVSETPLTSGSVSGDQIIMGEAEDLMLSIQYSTENCANCIDDDGDGLADCYDPDCAGQSVCGEVCYNGLDDDGDGLIDENDGDCPASAYNSCFNVDVTTDTPDANLGDGNCADASGNCSLRAAIQEANSNANYNCISFAVSGNISLGSDLPNLTTSMRIDGTSAPGYSSGSPSVWLRSSSEQVFLVEAATDIEIAGLDLSGTSTSVFSNYGIVLTENSTNININNNRIRNRVRSVYSNGAGDVQVTDNDFYDSGDECWDAAIYFKDICSNNLPGGIYVNNNDLGGVNLMPQTSIHIDGGENIIVSDGSIPNSNVIINSQMNVLHPIRFVDVRNSSIKNVDLSFNGSYMWGIGIWTVSCDNIEIDNVTVNKRLRGVFIKGGNNHTVTNSDFRDTGYNPDNGALNLENYNASGVDDLLFKGNTLGSVTLDPKTAISLTNSDNIVFGLASNAEANIVLTNGLSLEFPVRLNGADNITFKDIDFSVDGPDPFGKGIIANGSSNYTTVEGCTFKYRNVGAHLEDVSNATVSCNLFTRNNYGILCDNNSSCSSLSGNNFGCNSLAIRNRSNGTITTTDNYWGNADGSSSYAGFGDYYYGDVNAEQFSSTQKSCAPQISGSICSAEICDNGVDDDGDGVIDCADGSCLSNPICDGGYQSNAVQCGIEVSFNDNNEGWRVMDNYQDGLFANHSNELTTNQNFICDASFIPNSPTGSGFIIGSDYSQEVQCMKSPDFGGLYAGAAMGGVMHWYWWNGIPQTDSLQIDQNTTLNVFLEGMNGMILNASIEVDASQEWQFLTLQLSDDVWSGTGEDLEAVLMELKHIAIQVESMTGENQFDCAQNEYFAIDDILLCADTDRDGISDYLDNCPYDEEKTEPGICGCGMPDYDDAGNLNCGLVSGQETENVSDLIEDLEDASAEDDFFEMLIKYYEDDERVANTFADPDNIDAPGSIKSGDFDLNAMDPFKLYPNPNDGSFTIEFFGNMGQLRILDTRGSIVKEIKEFFGGKYKLDMREYPKGMYYVEVITNNASFKRRMVVD